MSLKPERVDFDQTWGRILKTCQEVIKLEAVDRREWNDRFTDVYKLCVAFPEPFGDKLYQETKSFLDSHVRNLHQEVINQSANGGSSLLQTYHSFWLVYREGVNYLGKLYMYLNTQHIKKQKTSEADLSYGCIEIVDQKLEIGELGLHLWKTNMIEPLQSQLVHLLLEKIHSDRMGNSSNESVVQGVILSFVQVEEYKKKGCLDLYQKIFEKPFLESTSEYYKREAESLLRDSNCSQYMEKVLLRLDGENMRSRRYLHPSSYRKVTYECELRMVGDHLSFIHGECRDMVTQDRRKDMQNMYKLLKPMESGLGVLIKEVQDHITKIGLNSILNLTGENMPQAFVENILDVHKKHLDMIRDDFDSDQQFIGALDKACATVINHRKNPKVPCKSPELLSKYCDHLLKKSVKGLSETEVDDKLSASITVFKYIDDKDIFQKFYSKMLAKRLINMLSVSMESEEAMINKLKNACGYEFTSKLHRMYTDIKLSDDLNDSFNQWCHDESNPIDLGIGFSIFVLQAGAWPLGPTPISPFSLPQPFEKSVANFELFYGSKFNGRKLTWLHHFSTAELKMSHTKRSYQVNMGLYHMAILLLFETTNSLCYKEIQENTKLSDEQLTRHLQSLIDAKILLIDSKTYVPPETPPSPQSPSSSAVTSSSSSSTALVSCPVKEERSASCSSGDILSSTFASPDTLLNLNLSYSNKRTKFKIMAVAQKEVQQQQEMEQTHASVEEDRKLYLQAAIVRIMKARKVVKHNSLIQEVIQQSKNRFTPSVTMIKKCVETLMDKQYLERTPNTSDEYSYIA